VDEYRQELQSFVRERIAGRADEIEQRADFPRALFAALGARGFYERCIDLRKDGHRFIPLDLARYRVLIEELARSTCFSLALPVSVHVGLCLPLLARLGTATLREDMLPRALRGELVGAIAATESRAVSGADFVAMASRATITDRGIRLQGFKDYITSGMAADFLVTFVPWRDPAHFTDICALVVPTAQPGVRRTPVPMSVFRSAGIAHFDFDGVELDRTALLGRQHFGMSYFLEHMLVARLDAGIWAVAVGQEALLLMQRYAQSRQVGDGTLWGESAVQLRFAEAATRLELLRGLVDSTIRAAEETGRIDPVAATAIKAATPGCAGAVLEETLHLLGARGLETRRPLLRMLAELRSFGLAGGSTEVMLRVLAELWPARRSGDAQEGIYPEWRA